MDNLCGRGARELASVRVHVYFWQRKKEHGLKKLCNMHNMNTCVQRNRNLWSNTRTRKKKVVIIEATTSKSPG